MALGVMILRKIVNNKWLELSLFAGLMCSVALASSFPIYTDAILQRMVVKDLSALQSEQNVFPGAERVSVNMAGQSKEQGEQSIEAIDSYMQRIAIPSLSLPLLTFVRTKEAFAGDLIAASTSNMDTSLSRYGTLTALTDLERHVRVVDGRLPAGRVKDGVIEVAVARQTLVKLGAVLGNEFIYQSTLAQEKVTIRLVGVIEMKEGTSLYWDKPLSAYEGALFIPFAMFDALPVHQASWYMAFDYSEMNRHNVRQFLHAHERLRDHIYGKFVNRVVQAPAEPVLWHFLERERQLQTLLLSLVVPVLIMLAFYLYMVSRLIMERQSQDIAVLRSRGASRLQLLGIYLLESLLLGIVAILTGPLIGLWFTKLLGSTNGFLSFVQRDPLDTRLSVEAFLYGLAAVCCSVILTLVPVYHATQITIVGHKHRTARRRTKSLWHKYYIDLLLIAVSLFGLYMFRERMRTLIDLRLDANELQLNPLLFFIPALFVIGAAFLALRLHPVVIGLIFRSGARWWSPAAYIALQQIRRTSVQYQTVMVFLIFTISAGCFSASAARTLNENGQHQIAYRNGADIRMTQPWESDLIPTQGVPSLDAISERGNASSKKINYVEPSTKPISGLPGVSNWAKVFIKSQATFALGSEGGTATLIAVETDDFGRTAWFRDDLMPRHFNEYLNLMSRSPRAVLISKSLAEQYEAEPGDTISLGWGQVEPKTLLVYGVIDYFPAVKQS